MDKIEGVFNLFIGQLVLQQTIKIVFTYKTKII